MDIKQKLKVKNKIRKWYASFIRDRWGNLTDCYWNRMAKEEILNLEKLINL